MRFLQRHAELIVATCVVLSLVLGSALLWLVGHGATGDVRVAPAGPAAVAATAETGE